MMVVLLLAGFFFHRAFRGAEAADWPTTSATILSATVEQRESERYNSDTHARTTVIMHEAKLRYGYDVGGQAYENDRINFGYSGDSDPRYAHDYIAAHPVGSTMIVSYNPVDPSDSLLAPGFDWNQFCLGITLLLPAGLLARRFFKAPV